MTTASDMIDENYDDDDEGGLSGFWILIIFLVVLAAFAGIVYIAYQKGMHARAATSDADLPVIAADPTPVRAEVALDPVEPVRQEVFDELNDVPTRVVAAVDAGTDPLENFQSTPNTALTVPTTVPTTAEVERAAAEVATPAATRPAVTTAAPTQAAPTPAASTPAPTTTAAAGTHVVQVGAFGSNDEAMAQYGALVQKHGTLVANQSPDVQMAVVKGRTYYRLRLAGYGDRAAAGSACERLAAAGTDCFVKAR